MASLASLPSSRAPSSSSPPSVFPAPFSSPLVSSVPSTPVMDYAARVTIVMLPSSCQREQPLCGRLGHLLPFPRSFSHLLQMIAETLALPQHALLSLQLFIDEGVEDELHSGYITATASNTSPTPGTEDKTANGVSAAVAVAPHLPPHPFPRRRGGQLLPRCFNLLRDNDVILLLSSDSTPSSASQLAQDAEAELAVKSVVDESKRVGEEEGSKRVGRTVMTAASHGDDRVELSVVDRSVPSSSSQAAISHRFVVPWRRPLQKLFVRYAAFRKWDVQTLRFSVKRKPEAELEWEEELSAVDTCQSKAIANNDTVYVRRVSLAR